MGRWNSGDAQEWVLNGLKAFLNQKADRPISSDSRIRSRGYDSPLAALSDFEPDDSLEKDIDYDEDITMAEEEEEEENKMTNSNNDSDSATSIAEADFFNKEERDRFFTTILPKMQALALRLPELIRKPIPLMKQQQDLAVTLNQEQIACLIANAFFNTFPWRNTPSRGHSSSKESKKQWISESTLKSDRTKGKPSKGQTLNEAPRDRYGNHSKTQGQIPREFCNADGQMSLFAYFGRKDPKSSATTVLKETSKVPTAETGVPHKSISISSDSGSNISINNTGSKVNAEKDEYTRFPSINFWGLFCSDDTNFSYSSSNAAKLRCIIHYFDRVTTKMPQGVVTFHRQVLKNRVSLNVDERISTAPLYCVKLRVDIDSPLEDEAPPRALQLDFANKTIGGGVIGHGAVQEEIRFVICPELIASRLFTQTMQENEAVLIKGAERYSNYNGYGTTFSWHSDHVDDTPRDHLGRRKTEICAIDAAPFKSKEQRLRQFSRGFILYSKDDQDDKLPLGRDIVYYTYGLEDLGKEIEMFMKQLCANPQVFDPGETLEWKQTVILVGVRWMIHVGGPAVSVVLQNEAVIDSIKYPEDTSSTVLLGPILDPDSTPELRVQPGRG
ncbi:hypothetical protein BGZ65_001293, partial [Modicella reniformis]